MAKKANVVKESKIEPKVTNVEVRIAPINVKTIKIGIKGKSPLLMDKMPDETKMAILAKQTGVTKTNKQLRDVAKEQMRAVHLTPSGKIGFPSAGFKSGMIESTSFVGDKMFSKKLLKGVKIMNGPIIPIDFKKQSVLEHSIGANTKFSPQFEDWKCELHIQYDGNNISAQDLVILLNYAGFYYGIGIWSPRSKCGGDFGMYEVATK